MGHLMLKRTETKTVSERDRTLEYMRRRTLCVLGLTSLAGLAGCTGNLERIDSDDDDGTESDITENVANESSGDQDDEIGDGEGDAETGDGDPNEETNGSQQDDETTANDGPNDTVSNDSDADDVSPADDESSNEQNGDNDTAEQDQSDPETTELTVAVIDDADNSIEGATLTLIPHLEGVDAPDHPMEHGETDADGIYTAALEHYDYTIEVEHPDYESGVVEHTHDGSSEVTIALKLASNSTTTDTSDTSDTTDMTDTSDVSITIVDTAGDPIEGASVRLIPEISDRPITEGDTDAEGIYTESIVEQVYMLEIDHAEYEHYRQVYIHEERTEMTIELATTAGDPSFTLTVFDEEGTPIEGAAVALQPYVEDGTAADGETNTDGIYTAALDEISYTLYVRHPDYEEDGRVITLPRDADLTIELEPLRERADLTVSVVDSDTTPIEGALVRLVGSEDDPVYDSVPSGETDAEGSFTETVREDTYFIEVSHDEYERTEVSHEHIGSSDITVVLEER